MGLVRLTTDVPFNVYPTLELACEGTIDLFVTGYPGQGGLSTGCNSGRYDGNAQFTSAGITPCQRTDSGVLIVDADTCPGMSGSGIRVSGGVAGVVAAYRDDATGTLCENFAVPIVADGYNDANGVNGGVWLNKLFEVFPGLPARCPVQTRPRRCCCPAKPGPPICEVVIEFCDPSTGMFTSGCASCN
jgi:hypothetical protein